MTNFSSVQNFILNSDADSNKNMSSDTYSFSVSSTNVGVGSYSLKQFTIPLEKATRFYQIYLQYSMDSTKWYGFPVPDMLYGTPGGDYRQIATNITSSGSNLILNVYLVNADWVTVTFPAFTIGVTRRDFVDGA